jgi:hypothetical protein
VVPGTVTTHEVPMAAALHIRERREGRVLGEPEELMEESNMVLLRDILRGVWLIALSSKGCPSGPTQTRQGRKRGEGSCLPPCRCVAACCHQDRGLVNHGHQLG